MVWKVSGIFLFGGNMSHGRGLVFARHHLLHDKPQIEIEKWLFWQKITILEIGVWKDVDFI